MLFLNILVVKGVADNDGIQVLTLESVDSFTELQVEGSTYGPEGRVLQYFGQVDRNILSANPVLNELAHICATCNDSKIIYDEVGCEIK